MTSARTGPSASPYTGEVARDGHTVFYADLTTHAGRVSALRWVLSREVDLLYLNSFHSRWFTVLPLLLRSARGFRRAPVMISPRGEFNPAALRLGSRFKHLYAQLWRVLGLARKVTWVAASQKEHDEIRQMWGPGCTVELVASTDASGTRILPIASGGSGRPGAPALTFVGRVVPVKGLLEGLTALTPLDAAVTLDIYGPLEDARYWERCQAVIAGLPRVVEVRYRGELARAEVGGVLARSDALLLPTYSENFGHTIFEALASSCPVVVGADTPWTDLLGAGAGWVVTPWAIPTITAALTELLNSPPDELLRRRRAALAAVHAWQDALRDVRHLRRAV